MTSQEIRDAYEMFRKQYDEEDYQYNGMVNLVRLMANKFLENSSEIISNIIEHKANPENEWLTKYQFCEKYPIMQPDYFDEFTRFKKETDYFKQLDKKTVLVNPKNFFKYIRDNRSDFSRLHSRLKKENFFGLLEEQTSDHK